MGKPMRPAPIQPTVCLSRALLVMADSFACVAADMLRAAPAQASPSPSSSSARKSGVVGPNPSGSSDGGAGGLASAASAVRIIPATEALRSGAQPRSRRAGRRSRPRSCCGSVRQPRRTRDRDRHGLREPGGNRAAVMARIVGDLSQRRGEACRQHPAGVGIVDGTVDISPRRATTRRLRPGRRRSTSAAREARAADRARSDRSAISALRVSSDPDRRNASGEPRKPFGQQIAVVVGAGGGDGVADLVPPVLDRGFFSGAFDEQRLAAGDHRTPGAPEEAGAGVPQGEPLVLGNDRTPRQDRGILQGSAAAVAEMGGLGGDETKPAPDLVRRQRPKRFAFNRLGHDRQRAAHPNGGFQQPQQWLVTIELPVMEKNQRFVVGAEQGFRVGTVRRRSAVANNSLLPWRIPAGTNCPRSSAPSRT